MKILNLIALTAVLAASTASVSCERHKIEEAGRGIREAVDSFQKGWDSPEDA